MGLVMAFSFSTFADRLRGRLDAPLPGHDAQLHMAPRYRARQTAIEVSGRDCREAGVLSLVYPSDGTDAGTPILVLTVRREELPDHAGQISFPGGQREGDESLPDTALREAQEEVDLSPAPVQLLGALTPLFVPPSNFCVHPFVGIVDHVPDLRPTDREVGQILHVPLPHLLAPETRVIDTWTLHGTDVDVPYYDVEGHTVWGATAMMLSELLSAVADLSMVEVSRPPSSQ